MKRLFGAQSNNAAPYVNGIRSADPNNTDTSLTGRSGNCTNRILGCSNDRHVHTRLGGPVTSSETDCASFFAILLIRSRCYGGSSKEKAIRDKLVHDGEHVIGQPIQH